MDCCKYRAYLDARIGQAFAAMKVWSNSKTCKTRVYVPKTGGRWMVTSAKCSRQTLHTDFDAGVESQREFDAKCPGYFAMCTGLEEERVWVVEGSHISVGRAAHKQLWGLSETSCATLVRIPPHSIFFCRGDVYHCGRGAVDLDNGAGDEEKSLRYHVHRVPDDYILTNVLHRLPEFRPTFERSWDENESESEDLAEESSSGSEHSDENNESEEESDYEEKQDGEESDEEEEEEDSGDEMEFI